MNFTPQNFQNLGFAIVFCLVLIVLFGQAMNALVGEKGLILKTEFANSTDEFFKLIFEDIEKENKPDKEARKLNRVEGLKNALLVDTIGFIPVYFLLFTLMIWFLTQQTTAAAKYLAVAAAAFAIATVFFDLAENLKVFEALKADSTAETLNIASSGTGKWICFFVTAAILSAAFWKPHFLTLTIAALLIAGSAAGLLVLFFVKPESKPLWMNSSIGLSILGLTICGFAFIFFSETAARIFNSK